MTLSLYNTLTRRKEPFTPIDAKNVRMYVCGPTVYDRPHIGNARSVVVYDVLYRLLCHVYGKEHVTYVRNITDVDDKINARAKENNEPISALTKRVEGWFHDDMKALGCLPPTKEPHATAHIKQMIAIIEKLIANKHAYVSQGHVLFAVDSYKDYGALSGRKLDDLVAGARVEVESYKKHPGDFVLWKPADDGDDASSVFDSPWGKGRPGWHIECSAMSSEYLGGTFDIHGGGSDLMFPHHENEIAQSRCADEKSEFAKTWVHNGFLTVNGEKMSKSLGNFITVKDLLDNEFGCVQIIKGEVIRYALLSTKYNEPLDWNEKLLSDATKAIRYFYRALEGFEVNQPKFSRAFMHLGPNKGEFIPDTEWASVIILLRGLNISEEFSRGVSLLYDDLNTSSFLSWMHSLAKSANKASGREKNNFQTLLLLAGRLLGILFEDPAKALGRVSDLEKEIHNVLGSSTIKDVQSLIDARIAAKKAKNWPEADRIRKELSDQGIILEDRPDGTTDWRRA